ncbi:MAG: nitronate monooxygenase [Acidobacteriota bacterium]
MPFVGAPMFLVSTPRLVADVSEAGGLGAIPSLNYRKGEDLRAALREIRGLTAAPYAVSISRAMRGSAQGGGKAWKDIWNAGQRVGLIGEVKPAGAIVRDMVAEYETALGELPRRVP